MPHTIWTIGHSNREVAELVDLLRGPRIEVVADIRRFPGSRRQPRFSREAIGAELTSSGIGYHWLPDLGGRRPPLPESHNTGWRHPAFRGYADYMATEEFSRGLLELTTLAEGRRTAMMCSEAVWWRCHRRLVSDLLVVHGWEVLHILGPREPEPHRLGPPARVVDGTLTYPPTESPNPAESTDGGRER